MIPVASAAPAEAPAPAATAPQTPTTSISHLHEDGLPWGQKLIILAAIVLPFLGVIAAGVLLWGRGFGWMELGLFLGMYLVTVFGVTVGFHRLFTHRSFKTIAPVRWLLAIAGSIAVEGPVIKWCAVHRRHHQCSDHEGDPHSPHHHDGSTWGMIKGMYHAHMGWLLEPDPADLQRSAKDLIEDRGLRFIDRTFAWWVLLGLLLPTGLGWALTGSAWGALSGFIWGGLVRIFVAHHVTWSVNSVCHVWGSHDYESNDHSTNNLVVALFSAGEGWHNNHHAFPTSARHGLKWWQIDLSWYLIKALSWVGLAWDIRTPPRKALEAKAAKKDAPGE